MRLDSNFAKIIHRRGAKKSEPLSLCASAVNNFPEILECSSHREFNILPSISNLEGQSVRNSKIVAINSEWVVCKDQPEWCVNNRHNDLQFNARTCPES